jgi:hypothetical protein
MRNLLLGLIAALCILPATAGDRGGSFTNLDQMIEELNLRPYFRSGLKAKRSLKIAVFDNGFRGARGQIGRSLPSRTFLHPGPVPVKGEEEVHGFYMARILWSLLSLDGTDTRYAPAEFHLYNTFGYSNLKAAVEDASRRNIDIVLYSQTWEYGGNFDGRGFINALVNQALDSGILWINNAGNFGDTTHNAPVRTGADDWIKLPGKNSSVEIRCAQNPNGKCLLRSVLSWNAFADSVDTGTDKDLDFVLTDDTLNIIQAANLTQTRSGDQPGGSKYPREILTAELKPGLYFLRVKNRSKNFTTRDQLRITAGGDFISMKDADVRESLLPPADNARAITVGALDSEKSSVSVARRKPELYTNSLVSLSAEENFKGTSNSAAMVAAGAAILLSLDPSLTRASFLARTALNPEIRGQGLPLAELGFTPERGRCFQPVVKQRLPAHVQEAVDFGGTLVATNAGWKVFFPFDPITLLEGVKRQQTTDILVWSTQRGGVYHRSGLWNIPSEMIELVETPLGQTICSSSSATLGRIFRLPGR